MRLRSCLDTRMHACIQQHYIRTYVNPGRSVLWQLRLCTTHAPVYLFHRVGLYFIPPSLCPYVALYLSLCLALSLSISLFIFGSFSIYLSRYLARAFRLYVFVFVHVSAYVRLFLCICLCLPLSISRSFPPSVSIYVRICLSLPFLISMPPSLQVRPSRHQVMPSQPRVDPRQLQVNPREPAGQARSAVPISSQAKSGHTYVRTHVRGRCILHIRIIRRGHAQALRIYYRLEYVRAYLASAMPGHYILRIYYRLE